MFRAVIYFKFYNSLFIWNQIYYVDRLWCIELPWFMALSWRAGGLHVTLSLKNRSCICRFPAWRQVWFFIFVDVASAVAFLTKCHARRTSASHDSDLVSGGDWWETSFKKRHKLTHGSFPFTPNLRLPTQPGSYCVALMQGKEMKRQFVNVMETGQYDVPYFNLI